MTFDFGYVDEIHNKYTSDLITVNGLGMTVATTHDFFGATVGLSTNATGGLVVVDDEGIDKSLTISFNKDVSVHSFVIRHLNTLSGANAKVEVSWTGGSYTSTGYHLEIPELKTETLANPVVLTAGQTLSFAGTTAMAALFLMDLNVSYVPEPSTYALGMGLLALGGVGVRRLRTSNVQH